MAGLYLYNVTPHEMALKAAIDGNLALVESVIEHTSIDISSLAMFRTHSDRHVGKAFYLVFELVRKGDLAMLRYLVEKHRFSLRIREEQVATITASHQAHMKQSEQMGVLYSDDGSGALMLKLLSVYPTDSLTEYGEQCAREASTEAKRKAILSCHAYVMECLARS